MTADLSALLCPECLRVGTLAVEYRLVARPVGSHSLAGAQLKVSAVNWLHLVCAEADCTFVKAAI